METLDISESPLEQDAVEHLSRTITDTLKRLVARDVEGRVSLNGLVRSIEAIDLSGANIDPRSLDWIVENRYVDLDGPSNQLLDRAMESVVQRAYNDDSELPLAGDIDPELFDPSLAQEARELLANQVMMTNMQLRQSSLVDYPSFYTETLEYAGPYEQSIVLDSTTYAAGTYGGAEYGNGYYAGPSIFFSPWEWLGYQIGEQLKVRRKIEEF